MAAAGATQIQSSPAVLVSCPFSCPPQSKENTSDWQIRLSEMSPPSHPQRPLRPNGPGSYKALPSPPCLELPSAPTLAILSQPGGRWPASPEWPGVRPYLWLQAPCLDLMEEVEHPAGQPPLWASAATPHPTPRHSVHVHNWQEECPPCAGLRTTPAWGHSWDTVAWGLELRIQPWEASVWWDVPALLGSVTPRPML